MRSLLSGLAPSDIRLDPFPHIIADDPMDPDLYRALSETYPSFQRIGWDCSPERVPDNRRYEMSAQSILDAPDLADCWKTFVARHSDETFLGEVAALFEGHWPRALLTALDGRFHGHAVGRRVLALPGPFHIHQDARMEINTPVRARPSSVRGPHLDRANRIFSCLFYMRAPEDDSEGGELILYRWKGEANPDILHPDVGDDAVEAVTRIDYRANRLVIFPQSVHALHGVGIRHPTPHLRRYMFITAELSEDWLA